jgi:hypothetical protein
MWCQANIRSYTQQCALYYRYWKMVADIDGVSVQPTQVVIPGKSSRHKAKGHIWSPHVTLWWYWIDNEGSKKAVKANCTQQHCHTIQKTLAGFELAIRTREDIGNVPDSILVSTEQTRVNDWMYLQTRGIFLYTSVNKEMRKKEASTGKIIK